MAPCDSYPKFEENQVLTANQLNDLAKHFLNADRQGLRNLTGVGIACGLELIPPQGDKNQIQLTRGCGVTSEGYLVLLDEVPPLTRYRPYVDPSGYSLFKTEGSQIDLWELLPETVDDEDSTIENLTLAFLMKMAVLLYIEYREEDLKTCTGEDCDEEGIRVDLCVKKLLIEKDRLKEIIIKTHDLEPDADLDQVINARFKLVDIHIPRFYNLLSLESNAAFKDINAIFKEMIKTVGEDIQNGFKNAYEKCFLLLKDEFPVNPFAGDFLQKALDRAPVNMNEGIQYTYDFIKDLVLAYDEFKTAAFDLVQHCCPDKTLFPRHLMVGEAFDSGSCHPSVFRQGFMPSPIHSRNPEGYRQLILLFKRMTLLVDNFFIPPFTADIRITPSREKGYPLGQRAIPYYYSPTVAPAPLYRHWNHDLTRKCTPEKIFSYHAKQYATLPDLKAIRTPLLFDMDPYPFFRIEGGVRQSFVDVLEFLQKKITENNLPLRVMGLRLSEKAEGLDVLGYQLYDLEAVYTSLRSEYLCIFKTAMDFFATIDIGTTDPVYESAEEETGINGTLTLFNSLQKLGRQPIEDALVILMGAFSKNAAASTRTDAKGYYAITGVTPGQYDLIISFSKMELKRQRVKIVKNSMLVVNIQIDPESVKDPVIKETARATVFEKFQSDKSINATPQYTVSVETVHSTNKVGGFYTYFQESGAIGDMLDTTYSYFKLHPFLEQKDIPKTFTNDIYFPVNLIKTLDSISAKLTDDFKTFVLIDFETQYTQMIDIVRQYRNQVLENLKDPKYNPKGNEQEILDHLDALVQGCRVNRLNALYSTLEARRKELQALTLFSNFAAKHPGMEHMAGTPRGGTFILVYDEQGLVVADFSLPYICCSDCPPMNFTIMPEPPQLVLSQTLFCDQAIVNPPKFSYTPPGGMVKGEGVRKIGDAFHFFPDLAKAGVHTLTYEINGSLKASIQVTVLATPSASFRVTPGERTDEFIIVTLTNDTQDKGYTYLWQYTYKGGSTEEISRQKDPDKQKLALPSNLTQFKILLTAKNAKDALVCADLVEQDITVVPEVTATIDLGDDTIFCSQPTEKPPIFNLTPASPDGVVVGPGVVKSAPGIFVFMADMAGAGTHTISYQIKEKTVATMAVQVIATPVPDFQFTVLDKTTEKTTIEFKNLTGDLTYAYLWEYSILPEPFKAFSSKMDPEKVSLPTLPETEAIQIRLTARDKASGIACDGTVIKTIPLGSEEEPNMDMGGQQEFCMDPKTSPVQINVTPRDDRGKVVGSGVVQSENGDWFFIPDQAGPGVHTITFFLEDKNVDSLSVRVIEIPEPDFKVETINRTDTSVVLQFFNTTEPGASDYQWLYQLNDQPHQVFFSGENPEKQEIPIKDEILTVFLKAFNRGKKITCEKTLGKKIL